MVSSASGGEGPRALRSHDFGTAMASIVSFSDPAAVPMPVGSGDQAAIRSLLETDPGQPILVAIHDGQPGWWGKLTHCRHRPLIASHAAVDISAAPWIGIPLLADLLAGADAGTWGDNRWVDFCVRHSLAADHGCPRINPRIKDLAPQLLRAASNSYGAGGLRRCSHAQEFWATAIDLLSMDGRIDAEAARRTLRVARAILEQPLPLGFDRHDPCAIVAGWIAQRWKEAELRREVSSLLVRLTVEDLVNHGACFTEPYQLMAIAGGCGDSTAWVQMLDDGHIKEAPAGVTYLRPSDPDDLRGHRIYRALIEQGFRCA